MEDRIIVDLFLQRDEDAIEGCRENYGRSLHTIAYNLLEDSSDASECENDTYFKAWNSIPPHTPYDYLFAFLARITRNLSLDLVRKKNAGKRGRAYELSSELEEAVPDKRTGPEGALEGKELSSRINEFLKGLEREKQLVFMRRYWYGDSIHTIAEHMGFSESKVKVMLMRTRSQLKNYLEKEGYQI